MVTVMDLLNVQAALFTKERRHPLNHGLCRPPFWIFICNILFILPLETEWTEWRSHFGRSHSRIVSKKMRPYSIG